MDLALLLPLALLFAGNVCLSAALLSPRALSRPAASLLGLAASPRVSPVLWTAATAVGLVAGSSAIQLTQQRAPSAPEQLRALLTLVLGVANLVTLLLNRALAAEQTAGDRARLNLSVLQKQAAGLQSEYLRATAAAAKGSSGAAAGGGSQRDAEQQLLAAAQQQAHAAERNLAALKAQSAGLGREYDRLLAENDALKKRLARLGDSQYAAAADKKSS